MCVLNDCLNYTWKLEHTDCRFASNQVCIQWVTKTNAYSPLQGAGKISVNHAISLARTNVDKRKHDCIAQEYQECIFKGKKVHKGGLKLNGVNVTRILCVWRESPFSLWTSIFNILSSRRDLRLVIPLSHSEEPVALNLFLRCLFLPLFLSACSTIYIVLLISSCFEVVSVSRKP